MSTSITSHEVVSETIQVSAEHHTGTEWLELKWEDADGGRNHITLFIADNDARRALDQLAQQIFNATLDFEISRELESNK